MAWNENKEREEDKKGGWGRVGEKKWWKMEREKKEGVEDVGSGGGGYV